MLLKHSVHTKINIIDSIMGSGKTSWAIQFMKNAPAYQKFIYITPFINEVERIITSVNRNFHQPQADCKGETKLEDIKRLISEGKNIVSTHSLFRNINSEVIDLLDMENYTLILDEVMDVIEQVDVSKDDLKMLTENEVIGVNQNGVVHWKQLDYRKGYFEKLRNLANSGNLMMYEDKGNEPSALYWIFPVDIFKCFEEVFILTYMFDGQIQRAYFDLFGQEYVYQSVVKEGDNYKLAPYVSFKNEDRSHLKELINIYYLSPKDKKDMNKMGNKHNYFSVSDLKKKTKNKDTKKVIRDNAYNFYRNKCNVPTTEVMWTTFKEFKDSLAPMGLKEHFVSVNARATNQFQHKRTCIYLANIYTNPLIKHFFNKQGIQLNGDLFALSELLQWLFRSRIRTGKSIDVFIPSKRMRTLLEQYLNNEI
ncbi:TPA: DEAD/DEAH box helicase family protein [Bacillus cereus]